MDPNRIIQALKGTIDPKLRLAAENELNQVSDPSGEVSLGNRITKTPEMPSVNVGLILMPKTNIIQMYLITALFILC